MVAQEGAAPDREDITCKTACGVICYILCMDDVIRWTLRVVQSAICEIVRLEHRRRPKCRGVGIGGILQFLSQVLAEEQHLIWRDGLVAEEHVERVHTAHMFVLPLKV